jgi:hypothetical protein
MINKKFRNFSFLFIFFIMTLSGCSRFDKSAIPLYDDVFVPIADDKNEARRTPAKNPMMMPPGYKKPAFNSGMDEKPSTEMVIQEDKRTKLYPVQKNSSYPSLSEVPQRSLISPQPKIYQKSQEDLEAERRKIERMRKNLSEEITPMVIDEKLEQESLTDNIKPVTIIEPEGGFPEDDAISEEAEATHEFGTPQEVDGGGYSNRTEMNKVGYSSEEEMKRDQDQFRLKQFEYNAAPKISRIIIKEKPKAAFNSEEEPPKFLPESRYRARRLTGPVYHGSYNGRTYYPNEE